MAAKSLHIEAFQSVSPRKISDPAAEKRRITVAAPLTGETLQSRFVVIFYYNKVVEHETASTIAAWIRESLAAALVEEPALAGRLRRSNGGGEERWEIKPNDAGVRLVNASIEVTVADFLDLEDRKQKESILAYWADVDEENPDFSALFYVQVTQFQDGGYSVGISCSLLLSNPLQIAKFLKSWAKTHSQMLSQGLLSKDPFFQLSHFRKRSIKSIPLSSSKPTTTTTTTSLFKSSQNPKAASKLGDGALASFSCSLFVDDKEGLKVERCSKFEVPKAANEAFEEVNWEEFGIGEICLMEENKAVHVSYDILSCGKEGIVVVMLPGEEEKGGDANFLVISATVAANGV